MGLMSIGLLDVDDRIKALEFQYEQKMEEILTENAILIQKMEALQKAKTCRELQQAKQTKSDEMSLYRSALASITRDDYDDALIQMENFVRQFPQSSWADNAIYWMASIYELKKEPGLAKAELERLIRIYPKSDRAKYAEEKLVNLEKKG